LQLLLFHQNIFWLNSNTGLKNGIFAKTFANVNAALQRSKLAPATYTVYVCSCCFSIETFFWLNSNRRRKKATNLDYLPVSNICDDLKRGAQRPLVEKHPADWRFVDERSVCTLVEDMARSAKLCFCKMSLGQMFFGRTARDREKQVMENDRQKHRQTLVRKWKVFDKKTGATYGGKKRNYIRVIWVPAMNEISGNVNLT
jgi:hypothetical protein